MYTILSKTITVCALIIAVLLINGCQQQNENTYQGYVEGELLYIASPFAGDLDSLHVRRGETITKEQLLFKLDPEPEQSQFEQAQKQVKQAKATLQNLIKAQRETVLSGIEAQINQAEAELNLARARLKRNQQLYREKAIDKDSLDAAVADYEAKLAQLNQFKANLAEAKLGSRSDLIEAQRATVQAEQARLDEAVWALRQKTVMAPIAGIIFDTFYKAGEWVAPGKPVVSLLAAENIRIIFFIPGIVLSRIQLGQQLEISCEQCKKTYSATVTYISPEAEYTPPVIYSRDSNYKLVYRIKATPKLDEALDLHPGQPVYVKIISK